MTTRRGQQPLTKVFCNERLELGTLTAKEL